MNCYEERCMNEVKSKRFQATLGAVLIALLVAGCGDITKAQLIKAEGICGDRGGIRTLIQNVLKKNVVVCMDDYGEFIQD
jgi:hypothetical protein